MTKRTTVYLNPKIHQAVKIKAIRLHISLSDLVNEALKLTLKEDMADLKAIKDRAHEPSRTLDTVLKDLKRDGLL